MSAPNIPWTQLTFSFTPPDGSPIQSVTISTPCYGNVDITTLNQDFQKARGGQAYVYQHGVPIRMFTWHWINLNATERALVDDFFFRNTNYSMKWFTLSWAPTQPEVLGCGAAVAGTSVYSGGGYTCGERLIQDSIQVRVRLASQTITWIESVTGTDNGDGYDGYWDLVLSLEQLSNLPHN